MHVVLFASLAGVGFGSGGECTSDEYAKNTSALLQLHKSKIAGTVETSRQPPLNMFVAIMIERAALVEKRMALRQLWQGVDNGTDGICMRFAICKASDDSEEALVSEQKDYGDFLVLDCDEGYGEGLLTKKLVQIMQAFRDAKKKKDACLGRDLFMKTDADTFVSGYHLRQSLSTAIEEHGSEVLYAGVLRGSTDVKRGGFWIEPCENWANSTFPPSMEGGPGYVLGRLLIERIIDKKYPKHHFLWNEDKAVGVWIDVLQQQGFHVDWVEIPGTTGFFWDNPIKNGVWSDYPYALQHHLSAACITCLAELEQNNNGFAFFDGCFELDPLPEKDFAANWELEQSAPACNET
jgi:hypothetical protein